MRSHRSAQKILIGLAIFAVVLATRAQEPAHVPEPSSPARTQRIVLVGDSTVNHTTGWGSAFCDTLPGEIECFDMGKNGRSSKSYFDQGWWARALDLHPKYVLIQFGANDTKGKGPERETDPETTFAANLKRYVTEARAAGATPILVTSLPGRKFDAAGHYQPDLTAYAAATRRVGTETKTYVIDLNAEAAAAIANMTQAEADTLNNLDPTKPAGSVDRVHINPKGAQLFGAMVAEALFREFPKLSLKNKIR